MRHGEYVDIFSFTEPGHYLRKIFTVRKKYSRNFRMKNFAHKVGFRSPGTLSLVLAGKRNLSLNSAERVAQALPLSGRKKSYFLAMVQLRTARSLDEKTQAQETMIKMRSLSDDNLLQFNQYRFLATWYYPAICLLAGMKDVQWSPDEIAKRLGRGITGEQVKSATIDLLRLGLLKHENGRFVRSRAHLKTGEDVKSVAVHRHHQQMIKLAEQALEFPLEQREMNGLTVAIPLSRIPEVKERIRNFRTQMNEYLTQFEGEAEHVYQLNIQLFPLTLIPNEPQEK